MAKNNEKFRWLVKTAIALILIVVATAVAWGVLKERVNTNKERIVAVEEKSDSNQIAIIEMKADIKYIIKGIDEIKEELKND